MTHWASRRGSVLADIRTMYCMSLQVKFRLKQCKETPKVKHPMQTTCMHFKNLSLLSMNFLRNPQFFHVKSCGDERAQTVIDSCLWLYYKGATEIIRSDQIKP